MPHAPALRRLHDRHVFWINLERSMRRHRHMQQQVLKLFGAETRVNAVDALVDITDQDAMEFVIDWQRFWYQHHDELTMANKPPGKVPRLSTHKSNLAIKQSHLKALEIGINTVEGSFMVAEDDIMPRSSLREVPLPPADAEVAIWSGGLPMASVSTDDQVFAGGKSHMWVQVQGATCFNCLGAGLYEVTREAALHLLDVVPKRPMSWDHSWGFALLGLRTYRLRPNAFAQVGESVRNGKVRIPITER